MDKTIKIILSEWKEKNLPKIIERDILLEEYLRMNVNKIIVLTGFRRVGKTYLMLNLAEKQLKNKSREEVIYFNFEDERIPLKTEFLTQLIPSIKEIFKKETEILLLDEVQNIPDWSRWLRRIYDNEKIRIFVSGSTSKTSSKEIPTELRGRFLEIRVFPLSFKEFLNFKELKLDLEQVKYSSNERARLMKSFNEYLRFGGLPEIVLSEESRRFDIAQSYYQTVVRREIIERYKVKNEEALKALLLLLLNSTHYSLTKLYNTIKSMQYEVGKATIQNFINYIESSYLMFSVPIFSYKIKNQQQYPKKVYFIDNVFISSVSTKFTKNQGRLYENLVAVNLIKRFDDIYYWKNSLDEEVDFVIRDSQKVKQLIQVCCNIDEVDTKQREIRALLKASKELKCKSLIIITDNYETEEEKEWFGIKGKIKFIPLWKWLLERHLKM